LEAESFDKQLKGDSIMRKKILVMAATIASVIGIAEAKPVFITVLGTGVIQDSDRDSAASEAADTAVQSANDNCAGAVVRVVKSPPICLGGGDNPYTCTVIATATCKIGN
jgi:hypothetical protein